ncbi:MAG: DUF294 nucleotidyltransferase-like domain-containing protein [Planctomycetota bacterium]
MSAPKPPSGPPPRPQWRRFMFTIVAPSAVTFALCLGLIFAIILPAERGEFVERKKETIRELTRTGWSELEGLYAQEERGALTRADAQQIALARIEQMRYGDEGKDYFWITDMQPRMIMHPYRPELNGQDLSGYTDPAGKKLFVAFTDLVRAGGEGYTDYLWQWKDDPRHIAPKLSFVKGFAPWGWIIGTGVYLDDVEAKIDRITGRVIGISIGISVVIGLLLAYVTRQGYALELRRWQAENALRASEEKYRLLVEGTTEGILMVLHDRPVYANTILLNRLGYTERELADLTLDRIIEPMADTHARLTARDGTVTDMRLAAVPVQIGGETGQILSLHDITAHKKTEERAARLLAELQTTLPLVTRPVRSAALSTLACDLDTPIRRAAAAMTGARAGAILVKAPGGEPIGIVTDCDLRDRVLAAGRDPGQPVSTIMSAPLVRIPDQALMFEAARLMQERRLQHLVVTDDRGAVRGVLAGTEILHAQRHAVGLLIGEIERAGSREELRDICARLPVAVKTLIDSGTRVEHITRIITSVYDAATDRMIGLAEAALGVPPAAYTFLVLGSAARGEQTLATDQDNALVYADVPEPLQAGAQAHFLRLGAFICDGLDFIGYRRCKGETMAANPKWCRPLSGWHRYFTEWVTNANPQDLVDMNILFDFRCGHGDAGLVIELRRHLQELLAGGRPAFFFHLALTTLQFKPPRGFFGNIQLESGGEHPATFSIKSAIIPVVNFARIYALKNDLAECNTLERLARLRDKGVLVPTSHDELVQAYTTLTQMRLAHQAGQVGREVPPDNHISLDELTHLERSVLKKIFADIAVFQARLQMDFARTA